MCMVETSAAEMDRRLPEMISHALLPAGSEAGADVKNCPVRTFSRNDFPGPADHRRAIKIENGFFRNGSSWQSLPDRKPGLPRVAERGPPENYASVVHRCKQGKRHIPSQGRRGNPVVTNANANP